LGPPRSAWPQQHPKQVRIRAASAMGASGKCFQGPVRRTEQITTTVHLDREDRMTRTRRTIGLIAVVLLLTATVTTAQAQPQFSGTWTLDPEQSQFPAHEGRHGHTKGPDAAHAPKQPPVVKLIVEQNGANMKVTRSMARDDHERSSSRSFVTDGTEQTKQGHRGSTTVTKATLGGDRLVTTSTTTKPAKDGGAPVTLSRESTWTLSPDGRLLTIDTVMHSPRGDKTMKSVFVKS
jgi:hypothetical protein